MLSAAAGTLLAHGWGVRTAAFIAALAPSAFLMGIPFPVAISRLAAAGGSAIPFAWAVNGFFSVAGASLASIGALWLGFRWTVGDRRGPLRHGGTAVPAGRPALIHHPFRPQEESVPAIQRLALDAALTDP